VGASPVSGVPIQIAAEAAVWVSRLHGPQRSAQMERECREWQSRSDVHRLAFERCTATWEDVRGVSLSTTYATATAAPTSGGSKAIGWPRRPLWRPVLAFAAVVIVSLGALFSSPGGVSTGVGERRVVVLDDGTRVSLNTDTRVRVAFSAAQRAVSLEHGEALFEVARDIKRPFVVRAAGNDVVAIGTVFSVRRTGETLAVTLLEGQVAVRPTSADAKEATSRQVLIQPGERLSVSRTLAAKVDKPRIDQITAWRRGEASFENASLREAVAEMNRYSRVPIVLADETLAARRISGVFHTGDNLAFAQAVAALHGLSLDDQQAQIALAPPPGAPVGAVLSPPPAASR
jgi:transmembrane sensor